ncbi:DUF664 domain-containing protein [Brevibacterium sp. K11IcPPYGO002]|uniref:mycothiol transferase n=1 Tax=Brevibacterium sp. K11IcPPYGO002 TaxID=3058837 RepID=UPI003D8165F3
MGDDESMKSFLQQSLDRGRTNLRWKLSGLDERSLRWPRTPTGFNLLGALKHMAQVEIVYFGDTFGRAWPNPDELVTDADIALDPQADWCATEFETTEHLLDLYSRVAEFADETVESLSLDSPGQVPPDSPRRLRTCRRTSTRMRISNACAASPTGSEQERSASFRGGPS